MGEITNYDKCMEYIYGAGRFSENPELKRTRRVLDLLGNPQDKLNIIHIAGTNGKGSTTAMIASILKYSNCKVGMFTSPFIQEFEERIQINNENISKEKLVELSSSVKRCFEIAESEGLGKPNQFEIITCIMFKYFYDEDVDYAVVEVGLGGRMDATNVITKPILCVLTSISFDHMAILGDTIEKIAYEKCGIIKNNVPVVTINNSQNVLRVISDVCKKNKCELVAISPEDYNCLSEINDDSTQTVEIKHLNNNMILDLSLLGTYQVQNCALAVNAALMINDKRITKESIMSGVRNTKWMCRMEVVGRKPTVVIDGGHNEDGILSFKNSVKKYFKYEKLILILGILHDKDTVKMIDELIDIADYIIFTSSNSTRSENPYILQDITKNRVKSEVIVDYKEAYDKALKIASENDMIGCCGSLYMAGDIRKVIKGYNRL